MYVRVMPHEHTNIVQTIQKEIPIKGAINRVIVPYHYQQQSVPTEWDYRYRRQRYKSMSLHYIVLRAYFCFHFSDFLRMRGIQ